MIPIIFRSKTVWASIAAAVAYVLKQPVIDGPTLINAVAGILAVAGVRDAYAKGGKI